MGDIKRHRKKYSRPKHPWQKERIEEEKEIKKEYGLLRNIEIWKARSKLKKYAEQAKKLVAISGKQADKEKKQILEKLIRQGLLDNSAKDLNDVLSLTVRDILDRRLQTIVFKKGLANTEKQARQLITHGHINIGDKKITSPTQVVLSSEEPEVKFNPNSQIADENHPLRVGSKQKEEVIEEKPEKKEKKELLAEEKSKEVKEPKVKEVKKEDKK